MASSTPNFPKRGSGSFQKVVDAFLSGEGLPFAEILSTERIERVFVKHGCSFGRHGITGKSQRSFSYCLPPSGSKNHPVAQDDEDRKSGV